MGPTDTLEVIMKLVGFAGTIVGAVWFLSSRIQRLAGNLETAIARMEGRLQALHDHYGKLDQEHRDMRGNIDRIEDSVGALRERVAIIERGCTHYHQK